MRWPRYYFDQMMEPKEGDSRGTFFVFLVVAAALVGIVFVFAVVAEIYDHQLGAFGDFFGGVLNPILSFMTFIGLLITIIMQQSEIRQARAQADKQAFETMFFQMLTLHDSIVNAIDLRSSPDTQGPGREWHGRDCFARFYEHLTTEYKRAKRRGHSNSVHEAYEIFWKRNQKDLAHYFRFLYNMIRIIDGSSVDKTAYMRLLRAQLSDYELLILFYNGATPRGHEFQKYIKKYTLFDNLPEELLLDLGHLIIYGDDAYIDPQIPRQSADKFLEEWRQSYIYAESRTPEELGDVMSECVADAKSSGVTHWKLEEAAKPDLKNYLLAALKKASGEE
ncbi:putative phage abortive infection protein [Rhizobium sp. ICMP 5592]|uniref:putative phage abortive infection protein n=1 Tax=Rhizobium sp. ICMP 5592 TaxID=2292445 RepID=UPI001886A5E6|nr:putative phage abortive infection protein [Rhizobium sp. ICMP 5592]